MIVRTDLPIEQQVVQACHAAYEAGLRLATPSPDTDYSVICSVDSEEELRAAHRALLRQRIPCLLFHESDMDDQATALAAAPVVGDQRKAFKDFPLWSAPKKLAKPA